MVEDSYIGSHGGADATPERRRTGEIPGWAAGPDVNPGAITGVWAEKNTRGAIYDALRARETFATSGTRIRPRFFGATGFTADPADPAAMVAEGYAQGVPMGGELTGIDRAPVFFVHALADPDGAFLDRIQIIKGTVDKTGATVETIHDVVWSGDREPDEAGTLPPVGDTVSPEDASFTNDIGSSALSAVWTDPEFDASMPAVYYMRVLEIPTPRWTTYDAVKNGLPLLEGVAITVQERAWTSPIWYTPKS